MSAPAGMRVARFDGGATPSEIRALAPAPARVEEDVRAIIAAVRDRGDDAVRELTARFDPGELAPADLRVEPREIEAALGTLAPEVLAALRLAIANVERVAAAQLREPLAIELEQGQVVELVELPVARAAAYVPGGRAPYPSTLVMCAATARAAGVGELAVCAPPGPGGSAHPLILAACCLLGVTEVYRVGGAQAVATLALGTESVRPVDVLVGPGNAYVQEAKRQLAGAIGIEGIAGPSELVIVASGGAQTEPLALDLLAQAEHGPDSLVVLITDQPVIADAIAETVTALAGERPTVADASLALVVTASARAAVDLADALAPEHLQLAGAEAEALAGRVGRAGALFIGPEAATAFGDYVAGSNHVLPTGGAARFQSALSPATFRRRMARVSVPARAVPALADAGATLARAEGFPVHAESMEARR